MVHIVLGQWLSRIKINGVTPHRFRPAVWYNAYQRIHMSHRGTSLHSKRNRSHYVKFVIYVYFLVLAPVTNVSAFSIQSYWKAPRRAGPFSWKENVVRSQTLHGPFSAVSTPIAAIKYSLESSWRDLFARSINSTFFSRPSVQNFANFENLKCQSFVEFLKGEI